MSCAGEHPTTRMCLLELEGMSGPGGRLQGARVMDYGAGSGVLALAALKLGAARAVGTDVDPLAVRSARRNAELNGYNEDALCVLQCGQSLKDAEPVQQAKGNAYGNPPQFDIVCANILRGPLFELAPRLLSYARPGSTLVLSGLLVEQVPEVMGAYAAHVSNVQVRNDGPWACVTALRLA
ncbi:ribosomal protein L11 methyltransferase [Dunaliella salina]|uniref:ETFB lysine methyltransferase n=1 Tax=Dunaliella salina TaxID=3046 RepID=A0ABQ7H601_DUNSA|nr:ribosomal protein L11 methyltransferase [Dunaliella salina]|eukprot:KAF5842280.1 ribosomal protein L11 methyltransferase [Dunaliella salina]